MTRIESDYIEPWINALADHLVSISITLRDSGVRFMYTTDDFVPVSYITYEGVEHDPELLVRGTIALAGQILVRQHGCGWIPVERGLRTHFALSHRAFPEPVILSHIEQYCDPQEYENLQEVPAIDEVAETSVEYLENRIHDYYNPGRPSRPGWSMLPFRSEVGFSVIDLFGVEAL